VAEQEKTAKEPEPTDEEIELWRVKASYYDLLDEDVKFYLCRLGEKVVFSTRMNKQSFGVLFGVKFVLKAVCVGIEDETLDYIKKTVTMQYRKSWREFSTLTFMDFVTSEETKPAP